MENFKNFWNIFKPQLTKISSESLGLLVIISAHLAPIPTLIAALVADSFSMPSVDLMVFIWLSMTALFFKSTIEKNFLYMTAIFLGFGLQTLLMGLILFK